MMRSLWTAASGMKAQQTSLDIISNNLSNINTTGYKKETAEFRSLLYQNIQKQNIKPHSLLDLRYQLQRTVKCSICNFLISFYPIVIHQHMQFVQYRQIIIAKRRFYHLYNLFLLNFLDFDSS